MTLWEFEAIMVGFANFNSGGENGPDALDADAFDRLSQLVDEASYGD